LRWAHPRISMIFPTASNKQAFIDDHRIPCILSRYNNAEPWMTPIYQEMQ
jgi:hypothetical protein